LKEDDPDTVGRMIDYLYTYDYWDGSVWPDPQDQTEDTAGSSQRATKRSLMVNVQVYAIAGKYGIGDLMLHATNKFDRLVASRRVDETFCAAIREVYSSTPAADRGLRDLVTQTAFANIAYLVEIPEFVSVLEEFGEFAIELLRMTAKRNEELEASAMACVTDW
jgi:speckle-type POZ protein